MSTPLLAPVVWAQRKDQIFLSIDVQDVKDEKIKLEPTKLTFSGNSGAKKYTSDLEFLKEIDPALSKYAVRPRRIEFVLQKKEPGPYWESLLKTKGKFNWLKVDWNKWKDEDEADDEGFDMSGMSGMGGMGGGGMDGFGGGGMNFDNMNFGEGEDSDDDELPDLEKETKEGEKKDEEKKEKQEEEKKEEEKK